MCINIEGLSITGYDKIIAHCGKSIFRDCHSYEDCYDVVVSTNAIVKINGDMVYFDIGGRKTSIKRNEFFAITIS